MTAMKLRTGILAITMAVGAAFTTQAVAQNTDAIDQARSIAKSLQQKQANDTNAALDAAGVANPGKPAAGAPAPAVKPAVIPGASASMAPAVKPAATKATVKPVAVKPASSSAHNQLQHVKVVPGSDKIQIELSSSGSVTPQVSKLSSPARVLIEMPDTVMAGAQNKIAVGEGGVKGVRVGMNGKTPPTTSIVIDLEKALTYEMAAGDNGKVILTLHTNGAVPAAAPAVAKSNPAPAKAPVAPKATVAKAEVSKPAVAKTEVAKAAPSVAKATQVAKADAKSPFKPADVKPAKTTVVAANQPPAQPAGKADSAKPEEKAEEKKADDKKAEDKKPEEKKWAMTGSRDPFFSPVRQENGGSGCSTGKKCLEIGNINLRGVVKSDTGFIAVVTNNLNKAYFLRENDPVFNGYVMKITGDSVTFQETVQDKLGKSFTREVVKRIFTPAV